MAKQTRLRIQKEKTGRHFVMVVFFVGVLGATLWNLENKYELIEYFKEVKENFKENISEIDPARGTIYDRNFKQLAVSMERVSVYVRTREIESIPEIVQMFGSVLSLDETQLQNQLENGPQRVWIAQDISQGQEIALKKRVLPGVYLQKKDRRFYPEGSHAAHIVGYVENNIGLSGVEYYYDRLLPNRQAEQHNRSTLLPFISDLILTIDLKIQVILEQYVKNIGEGDGVVRAAAYIIENHTGEIIGGAQRPGFDPNTFALYSHDILENMFLVPMLLPDKIRLFLRDAALIYANGDGGISHTSWSLSPSVDDNFGGQLRLWEKLGLGEKLAVDFGSFEGEAKNAEEKQRPVFRSKRLFGLAPEHETPLNILTSFAFLLNGGKSLRPHVVKERKGDEREEGFFLSDQKQDGLPLTDSQGVAYDVEQLFRSQAVEKESKTLYFKDEIQVYASPGNRLSINSMMIAKIPAGSTNLLMLVVVEREPVEPKRKGVKTMPTLEQIVEKRVERISVLQQVAKSVADVVEPETRDDSNYPLDINRMAGTSEGTIGRESDHPLLVVMPDLEGMSLRKSLRMLQGIQLKISFKGTGRVKSQSPLPGTPLRKITDCVLILEKDEDMQFEKISRELSKEN